MGHAHSDPMAPAGSPESRRADGGSELTRIGKFYVFLREVRAELFDEAFQAELAAVYQPGEGAVAGRVPGDGDLTAGVRPSGDADAVVTAQVDQRWQLVLDCLGCAHAPFSQGCW